VSKFALVADPNPERFAVYERLLTELGLTARWARDGSRALTHLRRHAEVKLLVTELSLPEIDGFDLLRQLPTTPNAALPVIVASAFRELRESASNLRERLGIKAVLTASSTESALRRVFTRVLGGETLTPAHESPPRPEVVARRNASATLAANVRHSPATEAELQRTVERVARELGAPSACISVILRDRQWYRAKVGISAEEVTADSSFCRHVVEAKASLLVPDAILHPTFAENPHVQARTVRGYAGVPLIGSDGEAWGSLCVFDRAEPVRLTAADLRRLEEVAALVIAEIEGRLEQPLQSEIEAQFGTFKRRATATLAMRRGA
jgi:CheY-like chemotaxis protein